MPRKNYILPRSCGKFLLFLNSELRPMIFFLPVTLRESRAKFLLGRPLCDATLYATMKWILKMYHCDMRNSCRNLLVIFTFEFIIKSEILTVLTVLTFFLSGYLENMYREGDEVVIVHCAEYHIDIGIRKYLEYSFICFKYVYNM